MTSSDPLDVGAATVATVVGTGWVDVDQIRLAGSSQPLDVTWTEGSGSNYDDTWAVTVPVGISTGSLTFEAYGHQGNLLGTDSINITSIATNDVVGSLRISEINYHPSAPTAAEVAAGFADDDDFEFLEFVNVDPSSISLTGSALTNGVSFVFPNETIAGDLTLITDGSSARVLVPTQASDGDGDINISDFNILAINFAPLGYVPLSGPVSTAIRASGSSGDTIAALASLRDDGSDDPLATAADLSDRNHNRPSRSTLSRRYFPNDNETADKSFIVDEYFRRSSQRRNELRAG